MNAAASWKDSAPIFAALGDETRLALLARLAAGGPRSITSLTEGSSITRQAITQHLQTLTNAGLVRGVRAGRERIYEVEVKRFDEARGYLEEITREWEGALGRLKGFVEG